jgi:hypothetical protein
MKTHNRILFHCLCCGHVVHAEPEEGVPNCCGQRMTNAAAETVVEDESNFPENVPGLAGREPAGRGGRPIPR